MVIFFLPVTKMQAPFGQGRAIFLPRVLGNPHHLVQGEQMEDRRKEGTSFPEQTGAGANLTFIENIVSGVRLGIVLVLRSVVSSSFYKRENAG